MLDQLTILINDTSDVMAVTIAREKITGFAPRSPTL